MGERVFLISRAVVVVTLAVIVTILALPSPMRSAAWAPPRAPNLELTFTPNGELQRAEKLAPGQLVGPEGLAVDGDGYIYSGTTDGKIVRTKPGSPIEIFTETGGRPLGMKFHPNGDLIVADVMKGLLRVDKQGHVEVLIHEVEGAPVIYMNDVVVHSDGTVFFTDSSVWAYGDHVNDVLEALPAGRVIKFDIPTRTPTVIARNLAFANGLALSPDERALLVTESSRYRVSRIWLTGDRKHLIETVVDNLPGFPDNITVSPRGTYWVAMFTVRSELVDAVHPFPFIKDTLAGMPIVLRPRHRPYGLVFEMDAAGRVLRSFHDATGKSFRDVSTALERDGYLLLGTLTGTAIGRYALPRPEPTAASTGASTSAAASTPAAASSSLPQ